MANIQESLERAMEIDGVLGVALVDFQSGMALGSINKSEINIELAAAGNTEVVRAQKNVRDSLKLPDKIEDILILLDTQYHLIRMMRHNINIFFYLIMDRRNSNLGLARTELRAIDESLEL